MNILYVSLSYLPSRRASSVQVMRMCGALADAGHRVTLLAKRGPEPLPADASLHGYYGVSTGFAIDVLARPLGRGGGLVYALAATHRIRAARPHTDLVYSRDLLGAVAAAELGMPVVFEAHGVPLHGWQRVLLRRVLRAPSFVGLVTISAALQAALAEVDLLPSGRPIVTAHSAADPLAIPAPAASARAPRVGYVGSLYAGRGIELILELARRLPGATFEIIGGTEQDLARVRGEQPPTNLVLRGFVAPSTLPAVYSTFDVLLMPYPRTGVRGAANRIDTSRYCSPVKMFEYMAAGVAIIASDLPVLGEVLTHNENALIAPADDVAAWQRELELLVSDPARRERLGQRAREDSAQYTSPARVARILRGLGLDQRVTPT